MVILHIASIVDDYCSGASVAVKQYLIEQSKLATVALANTNTIKIDKNINVYCIDKSFAIHKLETPFNHPDIVIFHELYCFDYIKISNELINLKIPYIIVPHGGLSKKAQRKKAYKKIIGNLFLHNYFKFASAYHYLTKDEQLNSIFKKKKSFILPNGITPRELRDYHFNKNKVVFTFVGRIDIYYKGLDYLIESIFRIREFLFQKNVVFNLYGPENNDTIKLIKLIKKYNLEEIVFLHGPVNGEEKKSVLLNTTFFIQTSRSEGLPMGILEALSYSIPCCLTVGTNLTDLIIKYNAGFASRFDVSSICKMITSAVDCSNYYDLLKGANRLVNNEFAWDSVALKMIEKYKKIIKENKII